MSQTCSKCSRANPDEAIYCYHDGFILGNLNREGGPVAVGSRPFNSPFVFPDGHSCRSFNELARACNDRWGEARMLLEKGLLESFLTGLGRLDLVMAAQEARKFPDPDRALDQLLGRLPCDKEALASPQLQTETQELNLGVLEPGVDRLLEIHLENKGERLLYGDVTVRVPPKQQVWLTLDDKPGIVQRSFQFQDRMVLKVHLDRERIRASDKPLTATLVLDSSGGTSTIEIKAEVPIKPFPEGVLQGAKSARRIAELAKAKPKEAAPLFESGAVASWYKSNGWEYPIQGPPASGLGAVQQFFEALGLAPAPKVAINTRRIDWTGPVGTALEQEIILQTSEKKYVYAHGVSDHPWVQVDRAELKGPRATLKVRVPAVPDKPGESLSATLTVQSNGSQRFLIPITLTIPGSPRRTPAPAVAPAPVSSSTSSSNPFAFDDEEPAPVVAVVEEEVVPVMPVVEEIDDVVPVTPVDPVEEFVPATRSEPSRTPITSAPSQSAPVVESFADIGATPSAGGAEAFADLDSPQPTGRKDESIRSKPPAASKRGDDGEDRPRKSAKGEGGKFLGHLLPFGLLLIALASLGVWDYFNPEIRPLAVADGPTLDLIFEQSNSRFALEVFDPLDKTNTDRRKGLFPRLPGAPRPTGSTGNVCVRFGGTGLDSAEFLFGVQTRGIADRKSQSKLEAGRTGWRTVFTYADYDVEITQEVELVKGATESLDTCMVKYTLENKGNNKQTVGMRILLDTFIGTNDGVPFTIPGSTGFVTTQKRLNEKEIPLYIEAVENPSDPSNPGTVLRIGLQFPDSNLESPSQVLICGYQNGFRTQKWDLTPIKDIGKDSCVVIYWSDVALNKGEKRVLGYTYGLGEVQGDGRLALSAPGTVMPNGEFVLTGIVHKAEKGQKFKVVLPQGLTLAAGESEEKTVAANEERALLSWRIKAGEATRAPLPLRIEGAGATSKPVRVQVRDRSIFG